MNMYEAWVFCLILWCFPLVGMIVMTIIEKMVEKKEKKNKKKS